MAKINEILQYACRACSNYNTQPWNVTLADQNTITVLLDKSRVISADTYGREAFIAIGSFIEAFYLSATALGVSTNIDYVASSYKDSEVAVIRLEPARARNKSILNLISARKTVRHNFKSDEFSEADLDLLRAGFKELVYYPVGSTESKNIQTFVLNSYVKNINNLEYMKSVSKWVFNHDVISEEGMYLELVEQKGLNALLHKKAAFNSEVFKRRAIETVQRQIQEGAGWLLLSTKNNTVIDWIVMGRIFFRMALASTEETIGLHPMTSVIKSKTEYIKLKKMVGDRYPQMLIRAGYIDQEKPQFSLVTGRRSITV